MRMHRFLITLTAGLCFTAGGGAVRPSPSGPQAPPPAEQNSDARENADRQSIEKVIADYLAVTDRKDYEALKRAFHPSAKLMSVSGAGLREMPQEEWWARVSRIPGSVERVSRISLIDVKGVAAVARVDFEKSSDYISLLKIQGQWKIVNKTLSTML